MLAPALRLLRASSTAASPPPCTPRSVSSWSRCRRRVVRVRCGKKAPVTPLGRASPNAAHCLPRTLRRARLRDKPGGLVVDCLGSPPCGGGYRLLFLTNFLLVPLQSRCGPDGIRGNGLSQHDNRMSQNKKGMSENENRTSQRGVGYNRRTVGCYQRGFGSYQRSFGNSRRSFGTSQWNFGYDRCGVGTSQRRVGCYRQSFGTSQRSVG